MYRNLFGLLAIFAFALLLVGVTFSSAKEEAADFVFVNGTEPKTLDPGLMTGQPEGRIAEAIFEGLTYREARTLRPVAGVAKSWEVSEDRRTYTFHLREDARWTNGRPVTASDFVYTWRRLQEPSLGSEYAYILHMVRWAEVYNTYAGHAESLSGPVAKALADLRRASPSGVGAKEWQAFLAQHHVSESLKNVPDPSLQAAMSFREGRLEPAQLEEIAGALGREAVRRTEQHALAVRHFGVDQGVYAKDERTLVVELNAPTPYFLDITAFYPTFPVPREAVERAPLDWFVPGKIVSNGPFRLASWKVNDKIRMVRSDTYWGREEVPLRVIDALPIDNNTTALNLYLTGAADWTPNYPNDLVGKLRARPDFYKAPGMIVYFYRFNTTRKPFDDPRVRRAVCMAVDRQAIVDDILKLGQIPAYHLVPQGMRGYDPPESRISFDPAKARALLAEAGHEGGRGMRDVGILYNNHETHEKIAEFVANQLRLNLGIQAKAYNQEWQAYQASTQSLDYDIARAGWIGDYLDPNTFLDMWVTNGGNNQTGWGHGTFDRLIQLASDVQAFMRDADEWYGRLKEPDRARALVAEAGSASDPTAAADAADRLRMHLLREAEAILVQDEFPVMPIYFYVVSGLVRPHVKEFYAQLKMDDGSEVPNLQDIHPLRELRVERAAPGGAR